MTSNKAEIISKIYNDLSGFGSIQQTFAEARKVDKTITLNDIKVWKENNIVRKTICQATTHMWHPSPALNTK